MCVCDEQSVRQIFVFCGGSFAFVYNEETGEQTRERRERLFLATGGRRARRALTSFTALLHTLFWRRQLWSSQKYLSNPRSRVGLRHSTLPPPPAHRYIWYAGSRRARSHRIAHAALHGGLRFLTHQPLRRSSLSTRHSPLRRSSLSTRHSALYGRTCITSLQRPST